MAVCLLASKIAKEPLSFVFLNITYNVVYLKNISFVD